MQANVESRSAHGWKIGGRSPSGWLNLIVFFAIFYFLTFTFLIMNLVLFLQSLNSQYPYWTFSHGSTIGPGVSKLPKPRNASEVSRYETMIYTPGNKKSYAIYVDNLLRCLPPKKKRNTGSWKGLSCTLKKISPPEQINATNWFNWRECKETEFESCEPCSQCDDFGYSSDRPCFAVGANRVLNWRPTPFEKSDLPPDMPDYLKRMYSKECVYVTCDGDFQEIEYKAMNVKNIKDVTYIPSNCIPMGVFSDFFNQTCRSKSVRVMFKITPDVPVTIRCRLWAKNVEYEYRYRQGTTTFTVKIEGATTSRG